MWLSLILIVLICAIAFFQATQGLFSALIMTLLTLCCAAFALGVHEYVAISWLAPKWRPDFSFALALGASFGISLLLLRAAMDNLIRRSCLLPSWVDRVGGAVCGLVTGITIAGIAALCLQLVPFGGSFLGYGRVELPNRVVDEDQRGAGDPTPPDPTRAEAELWFTPDRFVLGMLGVFSNGLFSADRSYNDDNIDYLRTVGWRNAVPVEVPRYAPAKSIEIKRHEPIAFVYSEAPSGRFDQPPIYEPINPAEGHKYHMVRVLLKKESQGMAKSHLFTLRQFRVEGHDKGNPDRRQQFYPIAIQVDKDHDGTNRHVKIKKWRRGDWPVTDDVFTPREGNNNEVEIVFELPNDFEPEYLEYKRGARVEFKFPKAGEGAVEGTALAPPPPPTPRPTTPSESPTSGTIASGSATGGGNVRSFSATRWNFGDTLPVTLKQYTQLKNAEISHGKLRMGHLVGYNDEQAEGKATPVNKFDVPDDKKLFHLSANFLETKSMHGKALGFAVKTMQNYLVQDEAGNQYQLVGKYAEADVDGRRVTEVQFFADQAGSIGGVGQFDKIKERHLSGDYALVFLFLVDPGAKIVSFSTGGGDARKQDLAEDNIVAPK